MDERQVEPEVRSGSSADHRPADQRQADHTSAGHRLADPGQADELPASATLPADGVPARQVLRALDELLDPAAFDDYCPNGLQVEGTPRVRRIVTAVTATQRIVDEAAARGADLLLVHHGWFWRGEPAAVTGMRRRRLAALLRADINLVAYHLPLDVHPEVGNNRCLADLMGWPVSGRSGRYGLLCWADLAQPLRPAGLAAALHARLGREPLLLGPADVPLRRIAWCTGGAQDSIADAAALGADAYVSGEVSERTTHVARELGIVYAAAGHHATERGGVQALGRWLHARFGVPVGFVDDDNPV